MYGRISVRFHGNDGRPVFENKRSACNWKGEDVSMPLTRGKKPPAKRKGNTNVYDYAGTC